MSIYDIFKKYPKISTDSRNISQNSIFFSLKGSNYDGNKFASKALENGASYAVVDNKKYVLNDKYILVKDALKSLQNLATEHRNKLKCKVLAITGSNGKTTSKELCKSVLSKKFRVVSTFGNLNNHIGVPLSVLEIKQNTEIAIIEIGASNLGEISYLCKIAKPNFGVITNIGKAHISGFGSIDGVIKGKTELYKYINDNEGIIFINYNNKILMNNLPKNSKKILFGEDKNLEFNISFYKCNPFLSVIYKNIIINTKIIGEYNFENIALAITIGEYFEIDLFKIKNALENYKPKINRSEFIYKNSNKVILDAYNANPTSVMKAIENLKNFNEHKIIIILGDMNELGENSENEHLNIINTCLKIKISNLILVGKIFHKVNFTKYKSFKNISELKNYLTYNKEENSLYLIKGSRSIKLEEILGYL